MSAIKVNILQRILQSIFLFGWTSIIVLFFISHGLTHESDVALVKIHPGPEKSIWQGQKASFSIELLSPTWFSGTPRFDIKDIPNGLILKVQDRPVQGTTNIDGQNYTTQLHEFWFFPKMDGEFIVHPVTVHFTTAGKPGQQGTKHSLQTESLTLHVEKVPGNNTGLDIISTPKLEITETWHPQPVDSHVGDTFIRTITMSAEAMAGMFLPEISFIDIAGVATYRETPEIKDYSERGAATGQRTEKVTYLFKEAGNYILPAIAVSWWNITTQKMEQIKLPKVAVNIAPNPHYQKNNPSELSQHWRGPEPKFIVPTMIIFVGSIVVLLRYRRKLQIRFLDWRKKQAESETSFFRRFKQACKAGDPVAAYNQLFFWLLKNQDFQVRSIEGFFELSGSEEFRQQMDHLNNHLFYKENGSRGLSWCGRGLHKSVAKIRHKLRDKCFKLSIKG